MKKDTIQKLSSTNILKEYINGASIYELSKEYHFATSTIRDFLHLNNISIRGAKRRKSLREIPPIGEKFGQ